VSCRFDGRYVRFRDEASRNIVTQFVTEHLLTLHLKLFNMAVSGNAVHIQAILIRTRNDTCQSYTVNNRVTKLLQVQWHVWHVYLVFHESPK
jgi:hypothetical protein